MTYYINPIWFYLMNVSEGIKTLLCVGGAVAFVVSMFAFVTWVIDNDVTISDDDEKKVFKLFKKIIITSFISLLIGLFLPSKETCIEMMIASQVTHENVAATKEEIHELIDYVTDKVRDEE